MTLHFIHIGKTGGTALKRALRKDGLAYWRDEEAATTPPTPHGPIKLHHHDFHARHVPAGDRYFFCVRDPVERFVSAFYSRLNKGQPRYYFEWSDAERQTFETFPTPQRLAAALAGEDPEERALAEWAMRNVQHMAPQRAYLGSPGRLRADLGRIVYIARQETLGTDFELLKELLGLPAELELPKGRKAAHRQDPSLDRSLDDVAVQALRRWYREDYALLALCDKLRARQGWGTEPRPARRLRVEVTRLRGPRLPAP